MTHTRTITEEQTLCDLISGLGSESFFPCLVRFLDGILCADHVTLNIFDHRLVPHLIEGQSRDQSDITSRLASLYSRSFYYRHDPNLKWMSATGDRQTSPLLQQTHARDIANAAYRRHIYEENNLLDRLSLMDRTDLGWFILGFYRDSESGYFTETEAEHLLERASLASTLIKKHLSLTPPAPWRDRGLPAVAYLEKLVSGLGTTLSRREIEVCARSLRGMTREAVALDLGIRPPTVATLISRAYGKLNISSLNELFALCLAGLQPPQDLD